MKNMSSFAILAVLAVAACGPGSQKATAAAAALESAQARKALPIYDSRGVMAVPDGITITLDHGSASAAGLASGRSVAESRDPGATAARRPLGPGSRYTRPGWQDF